MKIHHLADIEAEQDQLGVPHERREPPIIRHNLRVADLAKLRFGQESMWVQITEVRNGYYVGTLENEPFMTEGVELGDVVYFEPRHIRETMPGKHQ